MSSNAIPDWIKNIHKPLKHGGEYSPEIDTTIRQRLDQLSLSELDQLADASGVRDSLGVLMPSDEWSREQYIEILSDIGEMNDAQVRRLRALLGIQS